MSQFGILICGPVCTRVGGAIKLCVSGKFNVCSFYEFVLGEISDSVNELMLDLEFNKCRADLNGNVFL